MKKTHTINIGHSIFNIDEDAYEILYKYLDSIKTYFNTIDNEGEIIKDFELRIAENFSSKTSDFKKSIDLNDVKNMIKIMGTLDDFKEIYDGVDTENNNDKSEVNNKLYRDTSNRIIAGVCSGIAEYFKIDPIIVRVVFFIAVPLNLIIYIILWLGVPSKDFDPNLRKILFRDKENGIIGGVAKGLSNYLKIDANLIRVIFFGSLFFGGAGLLFYLLLWAFTKEAKTIGQKMNMSGFNINLSNIEDFLKKKTRNLNKSESTIVRIFLFPFRLLAPLVNAILRIVIIFFKAIFIITIGAIAGASGILLLVLLANLFNQITPQNDSEFYVYELLNAVPDYFIIVLGISLVLTILISFLSAIYVMFNRKSNSYLFMLLFFMWFVFLGFTALSIPGIIIEMQDLDLLPNWIDGSYSLMYKWD
ncbi:MAG: PspC domain-containing protein [Flavobacteriaceae bacterium]|jgi:phage shock protein PspC (stress-responsive transcriptional regulator)|nr:PspC domain-containing protein [Flavobacteriaceae bacterium]MBT5012423.1 PspC domain-containing protein [Flavobacteriaceae bacterium]MBT5395478.1 PspC domain-containing protein [Flavobacteriaceae bacterium]MBT5856830.1 PspC domain-containing protein [Flavobacteriaceae bacterium]